MRGVCVCVKGYRYRDSRQQVSGNGNPQGNSPTVLGPSQPPLCLGGAGLGPGPATLGPVSHGHFRKPSQGLGGTEEEVAGSGMVLPRVLARSRAALTGKGVERPRGG